jgi:hypothetical protein
MNSDQPAFPDPMRAAEQSEYNQYPHALSIGLTKREYFAVMAMQGPICSGSIGLNQTCKFSIQYADELLKQLEQ